VRLATEAKSITLETWVEPDLGPVLGDAGRLQQIMWNLLTNAVKFTPQGGRVAVRLETVGEDGATQAQITVTDTGKGITPEFLPHIFERFRQADSKTTRQFGGLGLGLAIVRQLVELHGGTITADSPGEDQGATFAVKLPLLGNALRSTQTLGQSAPLGTLAIPSTLTGARILVVDDEADARNLLVFILEQAGAVVTPAASATEALTLLDNLEIDLLISDIGMPEMDGYMLMQQIQARRAAQAEALPFKTLALTAYAGDVDGQNARASGFECHLSKPFEAERLLTAIATLMNQ
jgi:CheY-like chemotaxis protein